MIIIRPSGGLGNRMRALDSALALGEHMHQDVYLLWPINASLNCSFFNLFETPQGIKRIIQIRSRGFLNHGFERAVNWILKKHFGLYLDQREVETRINQSYDFTRLQSCKRIYIHTCSHFFPSPRPFKKLVPIKNLMETIHSYQINADFVGVHIRRTDNHLSIKHSPTELFIEAMQKEINVDPKTRFFIASDSREEKSILESRFAERVVSHTFQSVDRNQPRAIQDALIDLYCLANCRKIIGSYWSSFSDTAAEINGIEKQIIKARSG